MSEVCGVDGREMPAGGRQHCTTVRRAAWHRIHGDIVRKSAWKTLESGKNPLFNGGQMGNSVLKWVHETNKPIHPTGIFKTGRRDCQNSATLGQKGYFGCGTNDHQPSGVYGYAFRESTDAQGRTTMTPNTPVIYFAPRAVPNFVWALRFALPIDPEVCAVTPAAAVYVRTTRRDQHGLQYHQLLVLPANIRVEAPTGAFVTADTEGTRVWWDELVKGLE